MMFSDNKAAMYKAINPLHRIGYEIANCDILC
jgi:hypothetical protein